MSISSEISRLQTAKEDLAASIEAKGVTVPAATKLDGYPALVDTIQTGSGGGGVTVEALSVTSNGTYTAPAGTAYSPVTVNVSGGGGEPVSTGVRFIDYDGTILHSYTSEEFAALSAMPANPTHTGLISQGWNWSLADAKAQVTAVGACDIGQMYITDDGKTRIYLEMPEGRLSPYLALCPNGTVTIDWGDNSGTDTLTGTSLTTLKRVQHTYPSAGSYVMTLTATSGSFAFYGTNNVPSCLRYDTGTSSTTGNRSRVYLNSIQRVELGSGVSIGNYAFSSCYSLASITIPEDVTSIGNNAFSGCYSLASITIPDGVTSIRNNAFISCSSLTSITIPEDVTSIGDYAFQYCYSLASITIPDGVTSIGNYAFSGCYALAEIHLEPTTPPTVSNSNAWSSLPTDCVIYVPYSADHSVLTAYKTATNYPSSSTYTYMEESA